MRSGIAAWHRMQFSLPTFVNHRPWQQRLSRPWLCGRGGRRKPGKPGFATNENSLSDSLCLTAKVDLAWSDRLRLADEQASRRPLGLYDENGCEDRSKAAHCYF